LVSAPTLRSIKNGRLTKSTACDLTTLASEGLVASLARRRIRVGQRAARPFPERRPAKLPARAELYVGPRSPTRAINNGKGPGCRFKRCRVAVGWSSGLPRTPALWSNTHGRLVRVVVNNMMRPTTAPSAMTSYASSLRRPDFFSDNSVIGDIL
jgi:hypothetical protein